MNSVLLIPVALNALVLPRETAVVEPSADFAGLPYFDGHRDVHPGTPFLGEEVVSEPFQNRNLYLPAGVHLHWSLPRALTRGAHTTDGTTFPAVPDRWLVVRRRPSPAGIPPIEKRWIVESNYLHPETRFGWTVPDAAGDAPDRSVLYARSVLETPGPSPADSDTETRAEGPPIALGSTGTEALSALVAWLVDPDPARRAPLEDQLEAIQFETLRNRTLDIGANLREARHSKGFSATSGGLIWGIRTRNSDSTATAGAPAPRVVPPQDCSGVSRRSTAFRRSTTRRSAGSSPAAKCCLPIGPATSGANTLRGVR